MDRALRQTDYREILRTEFESRYVKNPRYSQRAFARDLGIRSNRLSEVLNRKQGLSSIAALRIADKLGYSDPQAK